MGQLTKGKTMGPVGEVLKDQGRWLQTGTACTKVGHHVPPTHPEAYCFSLRGALLKYYPHDHLEKQELLLAKAQEYYPGMTWDRLIVALTHPVLMMLLEETEL